MKTLSVYTLGGLHYAIWEKRKPAVLKPGEIHWLPPVSPHIAAISIRDNRTLTLFDLAVCLGLAPISRDRRSYGLLEPSDDGDAPSAAFVIAETAGRVIADSEKVFALPECLASAVINTYTLYDSKPIAVIDTNELFQRVQTADFKPLQSKFCVSGLKPLDPKDSGGFTLIEVAGETLAVPEILIKDADPSEAAVYPLQPVPRFIAGLGFHKGEPVPVVDLPGRLNLKPAEAMDRMLDIDLGRQRIRLRIGALRDDIAAEAAEIKSLPPLLQTPWRHAAAIRNGEIHPILDVAGLFGAGTDSETHPAYTTASEFSSLFKREKIEVVEFDVWGFRHALPGNETTASIDVRPIRPLTEAKPLVAGVSEYNGELLPVLDLARCFGGCAEPTADWQMIAVANGDFKALILTERTYPSRYLPVDLQRDLPFENPEALVYGCYPDDAVVRLIFNAHAMAVHFDRVRHVEFFHALARAAQAHKVTRENGNRPPRFDPEQAPEEGRSSADREPNRELEGVDADESLLAEEKTRPRPSKQTSEDDSQQEAAIQDAHIAVGGDHAELASVLTDQAPATADGFEGESTTESELPSEGDMRPLREDQNSAESFADRFETPVSATEDIGTDESTTAPSDETRGETSPQDPPLPTQSRRLADATEAPAPPDALSAEAFVNGADEADKVREPETPAGQPHPVADLVDEGPSESEDLSRLSALADTDDGRETPGAERKIPEKDVPAAETEDEGGSAALLEFAPPEKIDGRSDSQPLADAKPLPLSSDSPFDDADAKEAVGADPPVQSKFDRVTADASAENQGPDAGQIQEAEVRATVDADSPPDTSNIVEPESETDEWDDKDSEALSLAAAQFESAPANDDFLQAEEVDEDYPEEAEPPRTQSAQVSNRAPKKARFVLAAVIILLVLLFLGWRLEWSGIRRGVHTVRRAISSQVTQSPPADVAALSSPATKSSPVTVEDAAVEEAVDEKQFNPAPSFQAEPLLEPDQIKIIDKEGRLVIYRVRRGDTLWGISKRYTGSGFNYPKLAEDNEIENPDLIFPRQKITVK